MFSEFLNMREIDNEKSAARTFVTDFVNILSQKLNTVF